ncbi:DUF3147 family protein [Nonomuraea angiospora]|uniref:DUF3147 family protein n=1 Tax=Nonomuraea angiospora TaxID=46172 RepID=UPI003324FA7C
MCAPHWDSDAIFASLIGGAGVYAVTPRERFVWGGAYEPGSLIWRSRWVTATGIIECREALAFPGERGRAVLRWGPVAGGVFLAFPAILAATLTLIEEEEHRRDPAAQDARGAVLGATGMIAFAACVWALATWLPAPLVLAVATVAWAVVAGLLYLAFGARRGR